jgi:hypothetical protein
MLVGSLLVLDDWGPDRLSASHRRDLRDQLEDVVMMPLADFAQLAIAGKNRFAGRRRIVVSESIGAPGICGQGGSGGPAMSAGPA